MIIPLGLIQGGSTKLVGKQKRYKEAEQLFLDILPTQRRVDGDEHWRTLRSVSGLAMVYKERARYDEAEKLFIEALEGRRHNLGDTHSSTIESMNNLIKLYKAWNKPEKAEEWRAKLSETEAARE